MLSRSFFIGLLMLTWVNPMLAQNNNDDCILCKNGEHKNESPYKIGIKSEWPFLVVAAGAVTSGILFNVTDNTQPFSVPELEQLNRMDVNAFDRGATYNWNKNAQTASDVLLFSSIVLPTLFLINHHTRSDIGPLLVMGLEVAGITYGITSSVKFSVNRTRPYVYNTDLSNDIRTNNQSRLSFFSGHTSTATAITFFFAKVMTDYHQNMKTGLKAGLWAFAVLVPATTGYLRVKGGNHFNTDVITGYAIGALTGWLVPHLHKKKNINLGLSVYPVRIYGVNGMGLTYKL
jgi:membrane-associated phospholipid phosphatase